MNKMITASEVVDIAFNRQINSSKINDSLILSAQYKYLRPVLTEDLYEAFESDVDGSAYSALKVYTDQALAWWVKYLVLPELFVEVSDRGVKLLEGLNAESVNDQRFINYREHTREIAEDKTRQLTEHLYDSDYDGYIASRNPDNNIIIAGNIVFPQSKNPWGEDDDDQWNDHL
jgi:hypothetical protein